MVVRTVHIDIETPGDVAVRKDGTVAVADMTRGKVVLFPVIKELKYCFGIDDLSDVRSIMFGTEGQVLAACTFAKRVESIQVSQQRLKFGEIELPGWIDIGPGEYILVAEMGKRRLLRLPVECESVKAVFDIPQVQHLSCFAGNGDGSIWIPNRPTPGLIEWRKGQFYWHVPPKGSHEFTGICLDKSHRKGILILDRRIPCVWRFLNGSWSIAAYLPKSYRRLRALRSHFSSGSIYAYSVIDPPTSSILWLDEQLSLIEIWRGCNLDSYLVTQTGNAQQNIHLSIVNIYENYKLYRKDTHQSTLLPGQPRDLRLLNNGEMLIVFRDHHCVLCLDEKLHIITSYGKPGELMYPCSADAHILHNSIVVADPLHSRLVEFKHDGKIKNIIPTGSTYIRWVRCSREGITWIVDIAREEIIAFSATWSIMTRISALMGLELSKIESAEPAYDGGLLLSGQRIGRWAAGLDGLLYKIE